MPKSLRSSHDSASLEGLRPIVKQTFQKQLFQNCGGKGMKDTVVVLLFDVYWTFVYRLNKILDAALL